MFLMDKVMTNLSLANYSLSHQFMAEQQVFEPSFYSQKNHQTILELIKSDPCINQGLLARMQSS